MKLQGSSHRFRKSTLTLAVTLVKSGESFVLQNAKWALC